MARDAGVSDEVTLLRWYGKRAENGHPEPVEHDGPRMLFDRADWHAWLTRHRDAKKATLTPVDRSGDPDELISVTEFAQLLGYSGADPGATIRAYVRQHPDYLPPHLRGAQRARTPLLVPP
jgi:hypothetical protein